jgi:hypothetical protein
VAHTRTAQVFGADPIPKELHHAPPQDLADATAAKTKALPELFPAVWLATCPAAVELYECAVALRQGIKGSLWQRA